MANLIVKGTKTNKERTITEAAYKRLAANGFGEDLKVIRRVADKPADLVKAGKAKKEPTGEAAGNETPNAADQEKPEKPV